MGLDMEAEGAGGSGTDKVGSGSCEAGIVGAIAVSLGTGTGGGGGGAAQELACFKAVDTVDANEAPLSSFIVALPTSQTMTLYC